MVKIRLQRGGVRKHPYYRLVVTDSRASRDGKFVERIGSYNPMVKENRVTLDMDRVKYWLSVGAQPTERVQKLLKEFNVVAG